MPLEPNTQTFVDISTDVKNRVDSGELVAENAPDYMQRRWGISVEEYNNATARARKDEDAYYARKEQMEKSPLAFLGSKPPVPAHLRSVEDEGLLSLPGRFITNTVTGAIGKAVKGIGQVAGIALGEKRTQRANDLMSQAEDALSANEYTAPFVRAVKGTFTDPALNTAEDISADILSIFVPGGAATKALRATTLLKGSNILAPALGYSAADAIVGDKDESFVKTIIEQFPETRPLLENLAVNPDDPVALNMLRKVLEGVALGVPLDAAVIGISKFFKSKAAANAAAQAASPPTGTTPGAAAPPPGAASQAASPPPGAAAPPPGAASQAASPPPGAAAPPPGAASQAAAPPPGAAFQAASPPPGAAARVFDDPITLPFDPALAKKTNLFDKLTFNKLNTKAGLDPITFRSIEEFNLSKLANTGFGNDIAFNTKKVIEKTFGQTYDNLDIATKDNISKAFGRVVQVADGAPPNITKILNIDTAKRSVADTLALKNYANSLDRKELAERTAAQAALPIEVRTAIKETRKLVDDNSRKIIDSNLVSKDTAEAIENNMGRYLHTDFEIYNNPEWQKKIIKVFDSIPEERYVLNATKGTPEAKAALQGLEDHLKKVNSTPSGGLSEKQIYAKINHVMDSIKNKNYDGIAGYLNQGGSSGSGSNAVAATLKQRIVLTPELKPFYKEIEDPFYKLQSTISNQGNVLAEMKLLSDISKISKSDYAKNIISVGKGAGKLSEDIGDLATQHLKSASQSKNPLANIFVTKEYYKSLSDALSPEKIASPVINALRTLQYASSSAKTTLSYPTHIINTLGNLFTLAMNGNLPYIFKSLSYITKTEPSLQRILHGAGSKQAKQAIEEVKRIREAGLTDNSITYEFLKSSQSSDLFNGSSLLKRGLKGGLELASRAYKYEDSVFKIANFDSFRREYKWAYPNLTNKELDAYAAELTKELTPTYSRLSSFFKGMRNVPVIGVFPSFFHESFRVAKNMVKIGFRDVINGAKEGNPRLMALGAKRLASVSAVAWLMESQIISGEKENDITPENKKIIDVLSPIYYKDGNRNYIGGITRNPLTQAIEVRYNYISAADPFDTQRRVFKLASEALFKGEMTQKNFEEYLEKIGQILEPVINPSMPVSAFLEVFSDKTSKGADVTPTGSTVSEKVLGIGKVLLSPYNPGSIDTLWESFKSYKSEELLRQGLPSEQRDNKEYGVGTAGSGFPKRWEDAYNKMAFGQKTITHDINKSFQYKVAELSRNNNDIGKQLNKYITELSNAGAKWEDPEVVADFLQKVDDYSTKAYNEQKTIAELMHDFKKVTYREKKGSPLVKITDLEIAKILSDNGMRKINPEYQYSLIQRNSGAIDGGYIGSFLPPTISRDVKNMALMGRGQYSIGAIPSNVMIEAERILSAANGEYLLRVKQPSPVKK